MTPRDQRLWDLFEELQLQPGLLLGAGVPAKSLRSIGAESMQAVLGVAWKYHRERMLTRRPRPLDEWLRFAQRRSSTPSTCSSRCAPNLRSIIRLTTLSEVRITIERSLRSSGFQTERKPSRFEVRSRPARPTPSIVHPSRPLLRSTPTPPMATGVSKDSSFRQQILGVIRADARRCVLRGWLGVSHVASADIAAFDRWAEDVERRLAR